MGSVLRISNVQLSSSFAATGKPTAGALGDVFARWSMKSVTVWISLRSSVLPFASPSVHVK